MDSIANFFNKDHLVDKAAILKSDRKDKTANDILQELSSSQVVILTQIQNGANQKFSDKAIDLIQNLQRVVKNIKNLANEPGAIGNKGGKEYKSFKNYKKKIGEMIKSDVAVLENELPFLKHSPESPKDQDLSDEKALADAYYDLHLAERKLTDAEARMNWISAEERELSKYISTTLRKLQNYKFDEERVGNKLDILEKLEILSQGIKVRTPYYRG